MLIVPTTTKKTDAKRRQRQTLVDERTVIYRASLCFARDGLARHEIERRIAATFPDLEPRQLANVVDVAIAVREQKSNSR